jgi:hypothetical protein
MTSPGQPDPADPVEAAEAAARPRPFAIGLLGPVADGARHGDPREARLQVALTTHALGYFLLDVFEVSPREPAGYELAEQLARRTDADAFVVRGRVDRDLLSSMADRIRMRIRWSGP